MFECDTLFARSLRLPVIWLRAMARARTLARTLTLFKGGFAGTAFAPGIAGQGRGEQLKPPEGREDRGTAQPDRGHSVLERRRWQRDDQLADADFEPEN